MEEKKENIHMLKKVQFLIVQTIQILHLKKEKIIIIHMKIIMHL